MPANGIAVDLRAPSWLEMGCVIVAWVGLALAFVVGWFEPDLLNCVLLIAALGCFQLDDWRQKRRHDIELRAAEYANRTILDEFTSTYLYAKMLADDPKDNPVRDAVVNGFTELSGEWEELLDDTDAITKRAYSVNGQPPTTGGWRTAYHHYEKERAKAQRNEEETEAR